ncbi:uncharacterized protein A1O9_00262 [Exophiala aquamarina CBS 119918]|uniref:SP-RING-type domain-containing protein n=1 Tax=Exophiala aquamarina CBS 119918 TaxID=1182545 RepID=A0A072Q341_9EURO|nr:uncharacterized protein A1O9_00262 [Exophiala aquamarina CBS 119918]KEF62290.1 hypothetical protein A1O9_00262 [Exophiala aquamarina CBS 119918]
MPSAQNPHLAASHPTRNGVYLPFMNQPPTLNYWVVPSSVPSNHPIQSSFFTAALPSHVIPEQSVPAFNVQSTVYTNSVHGNPPGHVRQPPVSQPLSNPSQQLAPAHPQPQIQPGPETDRFFPTDHRHVLPTLAQPAPSRTAIHQVETHIPDFLLESDSVNRKPLRYYRYIEQIIILPRFFDINSGLFTWNLELAPALIANKVRKIATDTVFGLTELQVSDGSTQFRLKCIKRKISERSARWSDEEAVSAPTTWPMCLSISVNGDFGVDFRRKAHHGLDLSTDVTDLLHDGPNEIKVCVTFTPQEESVVYGMCLEIIRITSHQTVASMPQTIPSQQIKTSIMSALSRKDSQEDDDDLLIADQLMSIDLVDPFMSTLWVTPVRGRSCQHRECFDLEAFLSSRTGRVKGCSMTNPDQWKCPICRKDARPQNLIIDGFLLDVREQLEAQGLLDTKAILIKEDGIWQAKSDAPPLTRSNRSGNATTGKQDTEAIPSPAKLDSVSSIPQQNIVIVLDDA